ncbi:MAG: translesion error-prone DNA polymerase V autoproteolytic subunit [Flavobacteriaceae bacterium]|nr:translesion error-prone DNA polymerase V autoproteolytic subunit [Flavobacteriaceae bacterium]
MTLQLQIITPDISTQTEIPLFINGISCGQTSPAYEKLENKLDINRELVRNPLTTFYAKVNGQSMIDDGIADGDLLVIDRSLQPQDGKIAVCFIDGEFTCKRIRIKRDGIWLMPANVDYRPIHINETQNFQIWGIVTHVIKSF